MSANKDIIYMRRCLELASLGAGKVSPNPMVGAVIVHNGEIIGEGWHREYGKPHAEVNAVDSVADKSLLKDSTVYVSLEPCAHYGKTPPCAELLARCGFKKCVIALTDPNPKVNGKGIAILKAAGMEVETGVLEEEAAFLNRAFIVRQTQNRPYVILKYAKSEDNFIAPKQKGDYWLSNSAMRVWTHRQRSQIDAIMVGYATAECDNPALNVRYHYGRNPIRVIVDRNLSLDTSLRLFDQSQRTVIFNHICEKTDRNNRYVKINPQMGEVQQVLTWLHEQKTGSIVVEGGRRLLSKFLETGLWDEANVICTPQRLSEGIPAPEIHVPIAKIEHYGDNSLLYYFNPESKITKS